MGMTKPQPCLHHPNADPAKVPTGKVLAYGVQPDGEPTEDIIKYPCPYCWQHHNEWLTIEAEEIRFSYAACLDDLHDAEEQLTTAKADTARLAEIKTIVEKRYTSRLTVGQTVTVWGTTQFGGHGNVRLDGYNQVGVFITEDGQRKFIPFKIIPQITLSKET